MTKREAAIVSAYTGILLGSFSDLHAFVEEVLGRPVWTHEFGSKEMARLIKEASRPYFLALEVQG